MLGLSLGCAAGIMVTASHNPKEYNGYKVYFSNGVQIIPPHDAGIAAAIQAEQSLWDLSTPGDPVTDPLQEVSGKHSSAQWYYQHNAQPLSFRKKEDNAAAEPVVYTPLHGVGLPWVQQAFKAFGLPEPIAVPSQAHPDPEFPTVELPNPEEGKGVWTAAYQQAEATCTTLVLANDPDADRFSASEWDAQAGKWRSFTGNETGVLLAHWLFTCWQRQHEGADPGRVAMLASTVSSRMLAVVAKEEGFHYEETLTGFKWLGNRALELQQQGYHVLFAFEEAIGFMLGTAVRDKDTNRVCIQDGVLAAAVFAEMAADLKVWGLTVRQQLESLREAYGFHEFRTGYFVAESPDVTALVFARLREGGHYAKDVGGIAVSSVRDLGSGIDTAQPDGQPRVPHSPSDMMITYSLTNGGTLTLRASGTEPKLKYYLEVCEDEEKDSIALADKLRHAVAAELVQPMSFGMREVQAW
eukprot:jgi/Astpho2/2840/Aster-x1101